MQLTRKFPKSFFIKASILFISFLFLLIFPGVSGSVNKTTQNFLAKLALETDPDTNIVIIHINENDISAIGPWPIKRSYYALLISSLNELEVKTIGLEVFLSARFVTQSVYDNLLTKVIEQSGNVVLGSTAGSLILNEIYQTDSLSLPTPKLLNEKLKTGHLNFISEDEIKIPVDIKTLSGTEKAFSVVVAGNKPDEKEIELNFISSWKRYQNYSLLEFFDLIQNNKDSLQSLKDKIVIIGISDLQLAASVKSAFDKEVPGVALHAFAVENILNNRWLINNYLTLSSIIILIFLVLFASYTKEKPVEKITAVYISVFILFILVSFIYLKVFYIKLSYSHFIIPLVILFLTEMILYTRERKEILLSSIAETKALKSVLKNKETQLERLQRELDVTDKPGSVNLLDKIKSLKTEINRMKNNEDDKTAVEIISEVKPENFFGIVYKSKVMADAVDLIKRTAPEEANILILGESGTGKELAAKAIHSLSKRKDKNFVAVNCGALSDNLLESELFGHVKGAFTGSVADKQGRFEAADKGTIFLDEIAETSENFQVKLLRVLQSGEFEKVGSSKTIKADVRIIAATNKNLDEAVAEKKFREDLYYRLNVIKVELPPLRKRKEDIEILAEYFAKKESPGLNISVSVLKALTEYTWKGNVRELESVIKRASIFAKSSGRNLIQLSDLPKEVVRETTIDFEDLVLESLRSKRFSFSSISETAREFGKVNRTLVAENFRGVALKTLVDNNFDIDISVKKISGTQDPDVNERIKNKIKTFLQNIEEDMKKLDKKDFNEIKTGFSSKYKNLPQRFHIYLDEVIKYFL